MQALTTVVICGLLLSAFTAPPSRGEAVTPKQEALIEACKSNLGTGYEFRQLMIPMRDGARLSTLAFIPTGGDGPCPAILVRTAYGKWSPLKVYSRGFKDRGVAFITQDLRGDGDSEGKGTLDPFSFDNEIEDGYDTVEWLARQLQVAGVEAEHDLAKAHAVPLALVGRS